MMFGSVAYLPSIIAYVRKIMIILTYSNTLRLDHLAEKSILSKLITLREKMLKKVLNIR